MSETGELPPDPQNDEQAAATVRPEEEVEPDFGETSPPSPPRTNGANGHAKTANGSGHLDEPDVWALSTEQPDEENAPRVRIDDPDAWRERLLKTKMDLGDGKFAYVLKKVLSNVIAILRYHPAWIDVLAYDAFGERIIVTKPPPWDPSTAPKESKGNSWRETDAGRVVDWFARNERLDIKTGMAMEAVAIAAEANTMHPVRDYLRSLVWDGKQRLPAWLHVYCGAELSDYTAEVGTKWMISAVARPLEPGCQVDTMLILESREQGTGKSSAFRALVPDHNFYSETGVTIGDKDSYQALHGVWIHLFDELDSLRRGDITKAKNFLTARKDHYRPSYGRCARDFLRQNVFAGSTNEEEYLIDRTGNRRYLPVRVIRDVDVQAIIEDRDQLWAEAVARYDSGEKWFANTAALRHMFEEEQLARVQPDALEIVVARWLADPTSFHYEETTNDHGNPVRRRINETYDDSKGVLTADVMLYAVEKPAKDITNADNQRIANVLRTLGYERGKPHRENGLIVRRYEKLGEQATLTPPAATSSRKHTSECRCKECRPV